MICLTVVQWILVLGYLGTIVYSIKLDRPELNKITAILVLLRCYLPFVDLEVRRYNSPELFNSIFLVGALNGLGI